MTSRLDRALDLLERLVRSTERAVELLERGAGEGAAPAVALDNPPPSVRPKLTPEGARNVEAALRRRRGAA